MRKTFLFIGVLVLMIGPLPLLASADHYFYPEEYITVEPFYAEAPTIFQDQDGRYWMAFVHVQNQIMNIGITWPDDLLTWAQPIIVYEDIFLHLDRINFFQSDDGAFNLMYRGGINAQYPIDYCLKRSSDGINWGETYHVLSTYLASVIQHSNGRYCMVHEGFSDLWFRWGDDPYDWIGGWNITKCGFELGPYDDYSHPYLYEDDTGRLCLTYSRGYYSDENPYKVYFMSSTDFGRTWTEPIRISDGIDDKPSSITQDKDGRYWIVWESFTGVYHVNYYTELFYSTSWDLVNWTEPKKLLDENLELSLQNPQLTCSNDGRMVVVADYGALPSHGTKVSQDILFIMDLNLDIDNDGFEMSDDKFPRDPAASKDDDGDGYPDEWNEGMSETDSNSGLKLDRYPDDPNEWKDDDNDGYGDTKADLFPDDPGEWEDTDLDGHGDNSDVFPDDPNEWEDRDRDGFGDNTDDMFPNDPGEWKDTDGDRIGDNSDLFPFNPGEWRDTDLDGYGDNGDAFPFDPAASLDNDGDGYPDRWNLNMTREDSITGLKLDHFPDDPDRWKEPDDAQIWVLIISVFAGLLIILITTALLVVKTSPGHGK